MWQPRVRVHNGVPFRVGSSLRPNKCMNTGACNHILHGS